MVHVIQSKEHFERQLSHAGNKLIIINFCAEWCGPCQIIAPKLKEMAAHYAERVVILKVNVDDNEDITSEYNITRMPTFVFLKSGEVQEVYVGSNSDHLLIAIEKHVGDADETVEDEHQSLSGTSESAASGRTVSDCGEEVEVAHDLPVRVQDTVNKEGILE